MDVFWSFGFHGLINLMHVHRVYHGRLSEAEARRFFQQLIDGVEHSHSKSDPCNARASSLVYFKKLKALSLN